MIKDVVIKKIRTFSDDRGWLNEIYRSDDDKFNAKMSYASFTKYNVIRGPHEHIKQADFFVFIGPGDFELYLWDNRKDSETFDENMTLVVGESNKISVFIPPGVVHGYKALSKSGSFLVNLPDKLYKGENKKEEVDEIRHELDPNSKFKIV